MTHSMIEQRQDFDSLANQRELGIFRDLTNENDTLQLSTTLKQCYNSNPASNYQLRKKMEDIFSEEDEVDLDCEYDSQQRLKEQLPQPHPHQNQPLPIIIESYNHFAPLDKQKSQNQMQQQQQQQQQIRSSTKTEQINKEVRSTNNESNYNTNKALTSQKLYKSREMIDLEAEEQYQKDYMSSLIRSQIDVNQTNIVQTPQQIYEDDEELQYLYQNQGFTGQQTTNRENNKYQEENEDYGNSSSELYVWGRNQSGQLGIEPSIKSVIKIPQMLKLDFHVSQISCGKAHTALVTNQGALYTMGSNLKGQLGLGSSAVKYLSQPELVEALQMWQTLKVVCSRNSTFALMQGQEIAENENNNATSSKQQTQQYLFSWGSEKEGVLGLGQVQGAQFFPIKVNLDEKNEDYLEILDISAGRSHVGVVVSKKVEVKEANHNKERTQVYIWGSNKYGQLGLWDFESRNIPTLVEGEFNPLQVSCGDSFTIILTDENTLYSAGSNLQGQLGQGQSINKLNTFSQLPSNIKLSTDDCFIKEIKSSDYAALLVSNGDIYIWGPTPIGQFNSPQMLQDLIQNNEIRIKQMSVGSSFGLIQDANDNAYQLGSLFQENKNANSNFQLIEDMNFLSFYCGHDFVVASVATPQVQQFTRTLSNNQGSNFKPSCSRSMIRSNTLSVLQCQKNQVKKREQSNQQIKCLQILNQSLPFNQMSLQNLDQSPSQVTNPLYNQRHSHLNMSQHQQNMMLYNGNNVSRTMTQNYNSRRQNVTMGAGGTTNEQKKKHLDSCTPVRKDFTPTHNQNSSSQVKNHSGMRLQQTPSQNNTPNNMRLRISNNLNQNLQNNPNQPQIQNNAQNHLQSYGTSNADDILSQNLINTPQNMRRTFAGQPKTSLLSAVGGGINQNQQMNHATPPPFKSGGQNYTGAGIGQIGGRGVGVMGMNNNNICLSSSYAFNPVSGAGPLGQSMVFQSIDHQSLYQANLNQTQQSYMGGYGGGYPNPHHQQAQIDILIREKQEMQHQLQVEIQRRLIQEGELQDAYRQLDSINNQHQTNIHELTEMLDMSKRDSDSLMLQVEEQDQEIQKLKNSNESLEDELKTVRQLYEETLAQQQNLIRENEYLKNRVEVAQQFQQLSQQASLPIASTNITTSNGGAPLSMDKLKDLEESLQRKSKEIYELTVQLGCLKEENSQLKRDAQDAAEDFKERLQSQQMRAEAEQSLLIEDNEQLKEQVKELEEIKLNVEEFKQVQGQKDIKIDTLESELQRLSEELQIKDDNIKIHKREIAILQSEQDKLLKELKQVQNLLNEKQIIEQSEKVQAEKTDSKVSNSKRGSVSIQNKKALQLSTILVDGDDIHELVQKEQIQNNIIQDQDEQDQDNIQALKQAADDFLNNQQVIQTQNLYRQQAHKRPSIQQIERNSSSNMNNHQHQQTQILNPIETPLDSQRNSFQPVVSASSMNQLQQYQQLGMGQSRQQMEKYGGAAASAIVMSTSQLTPKQLMYNQLKQSMIYGGKERQASNREQGCLQVSNLQRRKSTQGTGLANSHTSNNQLKNLRSSKSGTNLRQQQQHNIHTQNKLNSQQANQQINSNNNMNKTEPNIQTNHSSNQETLKPLTSQRQSISNLNYNPIQSRSPINFTKKQQTSASQIKLQKHHNQLHMLNEQMMEAYNNQTIDRESFVEGCPHLSSLDLVGNSTTGFSMTMNNNTLSGADNRNSKSSKSPLRSIQNTVASNNTQSVLVPSQKNSLTPLSHMYQKHQLHHNNTSSHAHKANTTSNGGFGGKKKQENLENNTPQQVKQAAVDNKFNPVRQSIQNKSAILSGSQTTQNLHQNLQMSATSSQSALQTPKGSTHQLSSVSNRSNLAQQVIQHVQQQQQQLKQQQQQQQLQQQQLEKSINNTNLGLLDHSSSKNSLTDMRHKLQDIQSNKQYLEKKIYEYERKLNELKGVSAPRNSNYHNQQSQILTSGSSSSGSNVMMSQTMNLSSTLGGRAGKLNSLSAAILEKVLNDNKR